MGGETATHRGRYKRHSHNGTQCRLSHQNIPRSGDTPTDWEARAKQVTDLAWQLRDCDPTNTWAYLNVLPVEELRRLMITALAAIPCDHNYRDLYTWVTNLPAAK